MADEDKLLTTEQVADRLGLSVWTVRKWLEQGKLRGSLLSRRGGWRVREADLNAYLERRANRKR